MLVARQFLHVDSKIRIVFILMVVRYPEAREVLNVKYYLYLLVEESLFDKMDTAIFRNKTESVDEYYPCMKNARLLYWLYM
ncbi:MAG TPA: hypothetical protein VFK40_00030 [Nitrososphaeraceae archaeon]|nr:hypothetical protein [Nitrososphaeraceae archaeon]